MNSSTPPLPFSEIIATVVSLIMTITATFIAAVGYFRLIPSARPDLVIQSVIILLLLSALLLGNFVYQISRLGSILRLRNIMPVSRETLEEVFENPSAPSLCVLIPSYKEEICVLKQTVLSASLSEYPCRRVVVLIDDPPEGNSEDLSSLTLTRSLISEINASFLAQKEHICNKIASVSALLAAGEDSIRSVVSEKKACRLLSGVFLDAAGWIESIGAEFHSRQNYFKHTDHLFMKKVISAPADALRQHAFMLNEKGESLDLIVRDISRLKAMFDVNISSFERKKYINLSHGANKAMNLNSYISLIGSAFREEFDYDGSVKLLKSKPEQASIHVPSADFLLTLDADSFITHDYILKLTYILRENPRIAVAQTPYSAIPSAPGVLERTAGATTDVQYLQHQGYTYWNATFWVGANAILRYAALLDIRQVTEERGFSIPVYIQDKTVIEDTGSTIDLVNKDWILFNYPDRLSYSATPRDFGALIIQRRRWSNGGLILYPSMLQYARKKSIKISVIEFLVRTQYLLSPTLTNGALMLLFLLPFNRLLLTNPYVLLVALPYYYIYGRDLRISGYRWADLLRVYSLNLLPDAG